MDAVIGIALTATTAGVTLASGDEAPHLAVDGVTVSLDEGRSSRAQLAAAVRRSAPEADWISAGMSADLEAAVAAARRGFRKWFMLGSGEGGWQRIGRSARCLNPRPAARLRRRRQIRVQHGDIA